MGKTESLPKQVQVNGVATAAAAAKFGMECRLYGAKDFDRQKLNVFRMELMGPNV